MRSILKLMLANIRHGKGAFKGIVLLMMLITFSFSGTVSNNDRLVEARTEKFEKSSVSDVIVHMYKENVSDEMVDQVRENELVKDVKEEEMLYFLSKLKVDDKEKDVTLFLKAADEDVNIFTNDYRDFKADNSVGEGEIVLPYKMKILDGFKVGARIALRTHNGYDEEFTIAGFYEDVINGASTQGMNCAVISESDFERIYADKTDSVFGDNCCVAKIQWFYINGKDGVKCYELQKKLSDDTTLISSSIAARTRDDITDCIEMYSRVGSRTIVAFVALLLIVTLITMYNSISASIELDYTELGILKAQGFTRRNISLVYVLQYTLALVIGGIVGIVISIPACDLLIGAWKNVTGLLTDTSVSYAKCALLCVIIIAICTAFIYIATARINRISPVRAIAGGGSEVHFDSRLNTKIRQRPLAFFIALRQLNSRKKSYIGTVLIVMMLVFFIVTIMILTKGLDLDELFYQVGGDISISNTGYLKLSNVDELEAEIRKIDDGAAVETCSYHYMMIDGEQTPVHHYRALKDVFRPDEGRVPKYENEIMITKNVSERCGKEIGDTVTVEYMDNKADYVITGYFQSIWDFGLVTAMTGDGMINIGYDNINEAYVRLSDVSKQQEVTDMINDKYKDKLEAAAFEKDDTTEAYKKVAEVIMNALTAAMYVVILTFAVVIVNMVCKRAFIRERRDIGIFKAVGFTVDGLQMQFALRFTIVALIGSALGCILSILMSRTMLTFVLRVVGLTDFTTDYSLSMFITPAVLVTLSFFITSYISSRKIKSVQVRELISE